MIFIHCSFSSDPDDGELYTDSSWYKITLGEFNDEKDEGSEQHIAVEKIIVHPEYDHETVDYDIALIKLQSPAKLNDYVAPACLPSNTDNLNQTFPPGLNCEVSGWGSTNPNHEDNEEEDKIYGPVLKHDKAKLFSLEECREYYDELDELVSDQMMCAGELQPYLLYSYPLYFYQFKYAII